jgi:hypothetical protein
MFRSGRDGGERHSPPRVESSRAGDRVMTIDEWRCGGYIVYKWAHITSWAFNGLWMTHRIFRAMLEEVFRY